MDNKQKVRPQTIGIIIFMSLIILVLLHQSFQRIRSLYADQLFANASELREHFLQSTVKNLTEDITTERDVRKREYEDQVESCIDYVRRLAKESANSPEQEVKKYQLALIRLAGKKTVNELNVALDSRKSKSIPIKYFLNDCRLYSQSEENKIYDKIIKYAN